MRINKFGLRDNVPAAIKREVRQRDGFGCVLCGAALYDYDHVRPEFPKAREHRADGIALLCPSCHGKKTRNLIATSRILEAMKNPAARIKGCSQLVIDPTSVEHPLVVFAGQTLDRCHVILEVEGTALVSVRAPEAPGAPFRLSGTFTDEEGIIGLEIQDNEWRVHKGVWDAEFVGSRLTIRPPSETLLS